MDLLSSIIDNAEKTVKQESNITPVVIGNGFSEQVPPIEGPVIGEATAEIIMPDDNPLLNDTTEVIDGETFDNSEDFDILTDMEKKRNLLYANMYVILIDTGAGLMLQLASGNWSEDADKKYTLSKPKRMELAEAWSEILNLEGHKKDPKSTLWMMFGSFYLPLIIMAVKERVTSNKNKKAAKEEAAKTKAAKVVNITPVPDKQNDLVEVAEKLEVATETVEEEKARIAAQVEHANAITESEKEGAEAVTILNVVKEKTPPKVEPKIEPKIAPPEKETRGRAAGTKKNPKTGKFEPPTRSEGGYYYYPWGAKVKIKPPRKRK